MCATALSSTAPLVAGVAKSAVNWSGIAQGLGNFGSLLGGIGSLFGATGGTSVGDSKKLMQIQEALQEHYLRNYYTNARQSLESAGYNPMLAYMNTISGGQTNANATEGNEVGQRAQAIANLLQYGVAKSQIENTNAQTAKVRAETLTEAERPELIRMQAIGQGLSNILTQKNVDWFEKERQAELFLKYSTGESQLQNAKNAVDTLQFLKDSTISEQKYRDKHPVYNFVDRWSKAISPWVSNATSVYNASVISNSMKSNNYSGYDMTTQRFDRHGNFRGHTRTSYTKR